ncbi:hypothetical protein K490DRAFT_62302 [Saccharata proteae CBS 121410]|uniref:Uncharacterized protein n=1 Tax=Saccharata proteae CBS 121410 TaxID=1314787 RepID=A0A9P4LXV6_9PEZI|nr:hypothetical protein K490DRAFT_62302 [Saccharata proteae CBS 121410]
MSFKPSPTASGFDTDSTGEPKEPSKSAKIIGPYGVPGVGKETLLKWLKQILDAEHFPFFEGSEVGRWIPGSLEQFKSLDEPMKNHWGSEEPMALDLNDAFTLVRFVHAKVSEDLQTEHLHGVSTVILEDSMNGEGSTDTDHRMFDTTKVDISHRKAMT